MEKFIYLLDKPGTSSLGEFKKAVLGTVIETIRVCGASQITVNIADLSGEVSKVAPQRIIGPCEKLGAVISFWHDCLDQRSPIEACFQQISENMRGYLVTESVLKSFQLAWKEGERRPGVTQFSANGKPPTVSDEEFYHNWQVLHSAHSFALHPRRWSYVRNAVARPLTPDAPLYRAIVSEHFRELEDFTDDSRYFGAQEVVEQMYQEVGGFCDMQNLLSIPMSEYYFK